MSPPEFQAALKFRLLIPQYTHGFNCCHKNCGKPIDVYGYHALVCRGHFLPRHNLVRDALFDLAVKAGLAPVKDASVTCLGLKSGNLTAFRPADLLISGDDFNQDCMDITVVSPLVSTNQPKIIVGNKASIAEKSKISKHLLPCEQSGFGFKAFAIDIFGILANDSKIFLQRLINLLVTASDYPQYLADSICSRRISFAVQLGVY
jgi:hypothetical protein